MPLFPVQSFCFLLVLTLLAASPWTPTNATPQMNRRQNGSDPTPFSFLSFPSSTVSADYSVTTSAVLGGRNAVILGQGVRRAGPVLGSLNISLGCEYFIYTVNEVIPSSNLTLCDFHKLNPENYCLSANANTSPVMLNGVPTDAPVQGIQVDVRAKYVSIFSADIRSRLVREMISVQSKTHARSTQYETRWAS
ncbi:hypothetical protein B0H14DRAFT_2640902 [Mycena olivaceomarginata]|nr:hypothetical protein B0H14DRAFT_2640902 [Mycena olivaceomarginata]